ncbi:MAG: AAA domain-containing protein [Bacteroidia bacterium]
MNTEEYFQNLSSLVHAEREYEQAGFEVLMKEWSIEKRVEAGICWHPLRVAETGYGFGDYPYAILERTRNTDRNHSFGSGKPVLLYSSEHDSPDPLKAVVQFVSGNQIKLIFLIDDEPELLSYSKLGIVLLPDENSYLEQEKAMEKISKAKNCRLADLRDILLLKKNFNTESDFNLEFSDLNPSQTEAVNTALNAADIALIHGPPGTGKTTTVIRLTRELVSRNEKIMLTAASNTAVDLLATRAHEAGLKVLRIGNPARVDEKLEALTPEGIVMRHPEFSEIKKYRKEAAELRRMASKYKRNFGKAEREQRKLILIEAKNRVRAAIELENYLFENAVNNSDVICCTLIGSTGNLIREIQFDTVIIDEAAQATEPSAWVPLLKANKAVFAGDPFQLPPVVKSDTAIKGGLMVTLMEKLLNRVPTVLLNLQYRMNPFIMQFPAAYFYNNELIADNSVCQSDNSEEALLFIDTAGKGWEEDINPESRSIYNSSEALFIYRYFIEALRKGEFEEMDVGIISPYQEQIQLLIAEFKKTEADELNKLPEIKTIDSFQGHEKDVIIISLVRSNNSSEIGFLKDYRRMNVAMTRAKCKLIIVGDSSTLGQDRFYSDFIEFTQQNGSYRSVWEYNYD